MGGFKIDVRLEGDKFRPSFLSEYLPMPLTILAESGEIASKGRYAGKVSPFGMAVFEFPVSEPEVNGALSECYQKLLGWKRYLDEAGVEDVVIDIGNFEDYPLDKVALSKEVMAALSTLNANIEFHTVAMQKDRDHTAEQHIMDVFKKHATGLTVENLQKLVSSSQNHPSLWKTNALSYWLFLRIKDDSFEQESQNHLNEFDAFCEELAR
jgi:hypothetical protein